MKIAIALTVLTLGATAAPTPQKIAPAEKPMQLAAMCPKSGDTVSQSTRICTYRCLSGAVAITIPSSQLCPLSIDR